MLRRRRWTALLALLVAAVIGVLVAHEQSGPTGPPPVSANVTSVSGEHELDPDFSGFSVSGSAEALSDPRFTPALKSLEPGTLRGYPGGIGSNYVNWETGQGFTKGTGQNYIGPGIPQHPQKLSLFTAAAKAAGATPVFTLNVMTYCPRDATAPQNTDQAATSCSRAEACGPDAESYVTSCTNTDLTWGLPFQLRMLATAKSQGVPIKYVELGNELYSPDATYYFPTVQSYIAKANVWIAAIKQAYPGVQVGVVGYAATNCVAHPHARPDIVARQLSWNAAVYQGIHDEDAVIFHTYFQSGITAPQSVDDTSAVSHMLSLAAQSCIDNFTTQALDQLPAGLSAWITEWNLFPTSGVFEFGSWAQGLTEGLFATELARLPHVTLMDNETLTSTQIFGAILGGGIAREGGQQHIELPHGRLPKVDKFALSAGGRTLRLFNQAARGMTGSAALTMTDAPRIVGTSHGALYGQTFSRAGRRNLFLLNLSNREVVLGLGSLAGRYAVQTEYADPNAFVITHDATRTATGSASDRVTLPPYSATSLVSS